MKSNKMCSEINFSFNYFVIKKCYNNYYTSLHILEGYLLSLLKLLFTLRFNKKKNMLLSELVQSKTCILFQI